MSTISFGQAEAKYREPIVWGNVELSHTHSKGIDIIASITPLTSRREIEDMIKKIEACSQKLACYNLREGLSFRKINCTVLDHEVRADENLVTILMQRCMALNLAKKES
ncbi:MAG: hypothetical protein KR126chlam5_01315 [Candidatus Anoxychlamydiales bacterium]|nr:hypothetical protein [Candidatus Anoxychlamydiales bacterium]